MASFKEHEFNPYQPPATLDAVADDDGDEKAIFIPSSGRVIVNAALTSIVLGLIPGTGLLKQGWGALALVVLMPLTFSWHFCQTYRLPYRSVPKFFWLPWALVFVTFLLTVPLGMALRALIGIAIPLTQHGLREQVLLHAIVWAGIAGILCLAMDFSLTQYVPRKSNPKKTLFVPLCIALGSFLLWIPVVYFWKTSNVTPRFQMSDELLLSTFLLSCSFAMAVFYSLIVVHPSVRERMLFVKTDPRQFTKREFRL